MLSRLFKTIIIFILLSGISWAGNEQIPDFSEDSLPVLNDNLRRMRSDIDRAPRIYTGTAVPTTAPYHTGDMFIRTDNGKVYIATGASTSSDWKLVN